MHVFDSLPAAIVAAAFWIFLAASAVAAMKYDFRKRQVAMESLRAAIERGQSLEPAVVEKLLARDRGSNGEDWQNLGPGLTIGGIITAATGIGLCIAAFLVGMQFPVAKLPMLGAGVLTVCVGMGLLVAAWALGRRRPQQALAG